MNLREEIKNLSGNKKVVLTEGVKYFKFSKRFDNLIKKAVKSKNPNKTKFISALKKAREDFRLAEVEYDIGNKNKGKELYYKAKNDNAKALKQLLNNEMKSFILRAGLFGGFAAILFLLTKGAIDLKASGKLDETMFNIESSSKDIVRELQYLGKEKDAIYYDRKWAEISKRSAHSTAEFVKKAPEYFAKAEEKLNKLKK